MQKKSLGSRVWELFGPLVIVMAVMSAVEFVVFFVYYAIKMPTLIETIQSGADFMEVYMEMVTSVLEYSTEMMGVTAIFAIPILAWMMRRDKRKAVLASEDGQETVCRTQLPLKEYVFVAGISIPFAIACNNLVLLSNLAAYSDAYQETAEHMYTSPIWIQILCLGILIPIMEEYMFRGLIYNRMRRSAPMGTAIALSAIFFGAYHGNMVQMIYGIASGVLLAWLYEKYGSLKAPIFAHICMNLVAIVLTDVNAFVWLFSVPLRMGILTVACASLTSIMYLIITKRLQKYEF